MALSLQSIQNAIKSKAESLGLFQKKSGTVIGIDIGSSFLKVVQLKKQKGKVALETYGELALGPYAGVTVGQGTKLPTSTLVGALEDLFREANVTTRIAGVTLPLTSSLLSFMELPALPEAQLQKMIPIEARKYIPVPISEVTLDYWIIPETQDEFYAKESNQVTAGLGKKVKVMAVAIHNETISEYQSIVTEANLQNTFFELEAFSIARATFGEHTTPTMIFDMGARSTKLAIIEYGIVRTQHVINRGSQDITIGLAKSLGISNEKAEELKREIGLLGKGDGADVSKSIELTLENIFFEANRVLLNYQKRYNKTVDSVVLVGGGVLLKGMYAYANENLDTEVQYADPFARVDTPAFLEPVLKDAGPEFAAATGAALRKLQEQS